MPTIHPWSATFPVAFMSYAHPDDHDGRLSKFRDRLIQELIIQTGRKEVAIFRDVEDIGLGEQWRRRLSEGLATSTFLLPVVTPSFLNSDHCREEFATFLAHEDESGRDDLVLPIYYIDCSDFMHDSSDEPPAATLRAVLQRQYFDWRDLRLRSPSELSVRREVATLAAKMTKAMARAKLDLGQVNLAANSDQPSGVANPDRVYAILSACYRRAVFTRFTAQLNHDAMFDSLAECRRSLQQQISYLESVSLRRLVASIIAELDLIERCRVDPPDRDIAETIDGAKLRIISALTELARQANTQFVIPSGLTDDVFWTAEEAAQPPLVTEMITLPPRPQPPAEPLHDMAGASPAGVAPPDRPTIERPEILTVFDARLHGFNFAFKSDQADRWDGAEGDVRLVSHDSADDTVQVRRINQKGTMAVWITSYVYGGKLDAIPADQDATVRKLRVQCELRGVDGDRTVLLVLKDLQAPPGEWLAYQRHRLVAGDWVAVDDHYQVTIVRNTRLRFLERSPSVAPSSLEIRNVLITEFDPPAGLQREP